MEKEECSETESQRTTPAIPRNTPSWPCRKPSEFRNSFKLQLNTIPSSIMKGSRLFVCVAVKNSGCGKWTILNFIKTFSSNRPIYLLYVAEHRDFVETSLPPLTNNVSSYQSRRDFDRAEYCFSSRHYEWDSQAENHPEDIFQVGRKPRIEHEFQKASSSTSRVFQ